MSSVPIKAPFPWFGGKSRASALLWSRFGDTQNYVEPFAGSLAVLLGRPTPHRTETVNDLDCFLANFWRSVKTDPEAVAAHADAPVNEADLHARHLWLVNRDDFRERMKTDPDYFDPKIAGWWVWGQCAWIGSGWCAARKLPHVGNAGCGINRKLPHVCNAGCGINRKLPHVCNAGCGINRKLLHVGNAGQGIRAYFEALAERLRRVRVCCGDWRRVVTPAVTSRHGITAVLLDPPYSDTTKRTSRLYSEDSDSVAHAVREWAVANGDNPKLRIALCGYEGEHAMPADWVCIAWKAWKGYAVKGNSAWDNLRRERIWFSPHCIAARDSAPLLAGTAP